MEELKEKEVPVHIITILDKMFISNRCVTLMQNCSGLILKSYAKISNVNPNEYSITYHPYYDDETFQFAKGPLKVGNISGTLNFEVKILNLYNNKLIKTNMPKFVAIDNSRMSTRYNFEDKCLEVHFKFGGKVHSGILYDLSKTGIAIKVNAKTAPKFHEDDIIEFKSINSFDLLIPISASVRYIDENNSFNDEKFLKIGLLFDREVPINSILKVF